MLDTANLLWLDVDTASWIMEAGKIRLSVLHKAIERACGSGNRKNNNGIAAALFLALFF
jgi:hypothetical protein